MVSGLIHIFLQISIAAASLFFMLPETFEQEESPYVITQKMISRTMKVKAMEFKMMKKERIGDEYITESFETKLTYDPLRIYSKKMTGDRMAELLFSEGQRDNTALIHPSGFPWFNLNLDPSGYFMRLNQHHTIREAGYAYAVSLLEHLFNKYGKEVEKMIASHEISVVNGQKCMVIDFVNHRYSTLKYTVLKGEDLNIIARKLYLSEYKILEYNKALDDYEDVVAGQTITITSDYCKRLYIAIDLVRLIPISLKIYDEEGLFEQIEYNEVKVDAVMKESDFSEDNPAYGF